MPSTTSSPGPARRGRPPSPQKRDALLEAATEVFLREGYSGTSVDVVAAEAGVAKQTLYSHFGGKEELFGEVVRAARAGAGPPAPMPASLGWVAAPDLRAAMVEFGRAHLGLTMSPRVAALRRLIIFEAGRRPGLRELWNRDGPTALFGLLTAEFAALDRAGRLRVPDPERACHQLIALLGHEANMRTLYGVTELTAAARREIAEQAVDLMLRAHHGKG